MSNKQNGNMGIRGMRRGPTAPGSASSSTNHSLPMFTGLDGKTVAGSTNQGQSQTLHSRFPNSGLHNASEDDKFTARIAREAKDGNRGGQRPSAQKAPASAAMAMTAAALGAGTNSTAAASGKQPPQQGGARGFSAGAGAGAVATTPPFTGNSVTGDVKASNATDAAADASGTSTWQAASGGGADKVNTRGGGEGATVRDGAGCRGGGGGGSVVGSAATTTATATPPVGGGSDIIVIHVCDEARGVNKDFPCDRKTLLAEMRYFRAYLSNDQAAGGKDSSSGGTGGEGVGEEVDISVHCDVHIFEWLVKFIEAPLQPPRLDTASVVSILISSEFLEMDRLVNHCLLFMAARLGEIIKMPIDLNCLSERLLHKLADKVDAPLLASVRDKRDKLLSKLYKRRLELDFRNPPLDVRRGAGLSKICCCRWCGKLFHFGSGPLLYCDRCPTSVDFRGELVARHAPLVDWSLTECVGRLHKHGMSWGDIYWLLWGVSHVFFCDRSKAYFMASDFSRRRSCGTHSSSSSSSASGSSSGNSNGGSFDEPPSPSSCACNAPSLLPFHVASPSQSFVLVAPPPETNNFATFTTASASLASSSSASLASSSSVETATAAAAAATTTLRSCFVGWGGGFDSVGVPSSASPPTSTTLSTAAPAVAGSPSSPAATCSGFSDHVVDESKGAVCFVGVVRRLNPSTTPRAPIASAAIDDADAHVDGQGSAIRDDNGRTEKDRGGQGESPWEDALNLLLTQKAQLLRSAQHPAMQLEMVAVLKARAGERRSVVATTQAPPQAPLPPQPSLQQAPTTQAGGGDGGGAGLSSEGLGGASGRGNRPGTAGRRSSATAGGGGSSGGSTIASSETTAGGAAGASRARVGGASQGAQGSKMAASSAAAESSSLQKQEERVAAAAAAEVTLIVDNLFALGRLHPHHIFDKNNIGPSPLYHHHLPDTTTAAVAPPPSTADEETTAGAPPLGTSVASSSSASSASLMASYPAGGGGGGGGGGVGTGWGGMVAILPPPAAASSAAASSVAVASFITAGTASTSTSTTWPLSPTKAQRTAAAVIQQQLQQTSASSFHDTAASTTHNGSAGAGAPSLWSPAAASKLMQSLGAAAVAAATGVAASACGGGSNSAAGGGGSGGVPSATNSSSTATCGQDFADNSVIVPIHSHPLGLLPDDVARDLETIRTWVKGGGSSSTNNTSAAAANSTNGNGNSNSSSTTAAMRRTWEIELIQEHDAKRMLLLTRLLHQKRRLLTAWPEPGDLGSGSGNGGGRGGGGGGRRGGKNHLSGGDSSAMSKRWR